MPLSTGCFVSFFSQFHSRCQKCDIVSRVSLGGNTLFDIKHRVKHLKRNQLPRKQGFCSFAFGVQLRLCQKQALIKRKPKTRNKIRLREKKNISFVIMIGVYRAEVSNMNEIRCTLSTGHLISFLFSIRSSMSKKVRKCLVFVFPISMPPFFIPMINLQRTKHNIPMWLFGFFETLFPKSRIELNT